MSESTLGSLISAGGSVLGSYITADAANKAYNKKWKNIQNALNEADTQYSAIEDLLNEYRNNQNTFSDSDMVNEYKSAIENYNPEDYTYDFDKFSFDKSVNDYVTPYYQQIIDNVTNTVQNTASGAGLGRSGGTAADIATAQAQKEDELYKTALEEYNTDRSQAYQEYNDYIQNMQNKYNNLANLQSNKINLMNGAITHDETQTSDYYSDLMSLLENHAQSKVKAAMAS